MSESLIEAPERSRYSTSEDSRKGAPMIARCWSCGQKHETKVVCDKCPSCRGRRKEEVKP
jgi:ribosomal protein L32